MKFLEVFSTDTLALEGVCLNGDTARPGGLHKWTKRLREGDPALSLSVPACTKTFERLRNHQPPMVKADIKASMATIVRGREGVRRKHMHRATPQGRESQLIRRAIIATLFDLPGEFEEIEVPPSDVPISKLFTWHTLLLHTADRQVGRYPSELKEWISAQTQNIVPPKLRLKADFQKALKRYPDLFSHDAEACERLDVPHNKKPGAFLRITPEGAVESQARRMLLQLLFQFKPECRDYLNVIS